MKPEYITEATELTVPFVNPPLLISIKGIVKSKYTGEVIASKPTDTVELNWVDGKRHYSVAELMIHAFKPLRAPYTNLKDFTVAFKDGNVNNIHPSNLYWKPKYLPIESDKFKGTYIIPYYSRYSLTKDNLLLDSFTGVARPFYMDAGYLKIRLVSDRGNKQLIALHRLLAMTYLPTDCPVDNLVVDHINHDRLDNRVENLQWLSSKEHGIKSVAMDEQSPITVYVKNVITGEELTLPSIKGAAAYFGIHYKTMYHRVSSGQKLFYPGLLFQTDPKVEWREPSQEEINQVLSSQKKKPQIKITVTSNDGTTKYFSNLASAAEYTNVQVRTLKAVSQKKVPNRKRNGFVFTFEKLKTGEIIKPLES